MKIHIYGLYHTITSNDYSHCAFTGKVLRFSKMMQARGIDVVEYGNEGSESEASEKVVLRSRSWFDTLHPRGAFVGEGPNVNPHSPSRLEFERSLIREMRARVQPGDIVAHPMGTTHQNLVKAVPQGIHVETGIGYKSGPFGAYRIFESEPWRHWHLGRYDLDDADPKQRLESWVAPNYYDLDDWPVGDGSGGYFAFMARKCNAKGLKMLAEIIKTYKGPHHFRIAGEGEGWSDWADFCSDLGGMKGDEWYDGRTKIVNVGALRGRERAKFLGDAVALLCPTVFVEPFGGASIEAMLCGTPAICSDWGAYVDTIPGWLRCRTLNEYLGTMRSCRSESVRRSAERARDDYSLNRVGRIYADIFEQIQRTHAKG